MGKLVQSGYVRLLSPFPSLELILQQFSLQWTRTASTPQDLPGISLSLPTSVTTQTRVSLYLDQTPDVFGLAPDLALLLDMHEGDRVTILQALWSYIKMNGLQDEDKKHIRPDARTKKVRMFPP